jgi:hypothetical protein
MASHSLLCHRYVLRTDLKTICQSGSIQHLRSTGHAPKQILLPGAQRQKTIQELNDPGIDIFRSVCIAISTLGQESMEQSTHLDDRVICRHADTRAQSECHEDRLALVPSSKLTQVDVDDVIHF